MPDFVIEYKNKNVLSMIRQIEQKVENPAGALKIVGAEIVGSVSENFRVGGRPTPWKKSKRVLDGAGSEKGQTLFDKGTLEGSVNFRVVGGSVFIGTNDKRAPIHNFGGVIKPKNKPFLVFVTSGDRPTDAAGWKQAREDGRVVFAKKVTMPKREFLMVQDEDPPEICDRLVKYLMKNTSTAPE